MHVSSSIILLSQAAMKMDKNIAEFPEQNGADHKSVRKSSYSLSMVFRYADGVDRLLMIVGSVCSVVNGMGQPIMAILFGALIHEFGTTDDQHLVHQISKLSLNLLYLATGVGIAAFLQVLCWTITGERQATRLQVLYFKSLLHQEMGFFDTEMSVGQVISMASSDAITLQNTISQQIGKSFEYISTFIAGIFIAFFRGWNLSLVILSMIPALVIVGGTMARILTNMFSRQQAASSEAGDVVDETVGAIRTVSSLTAEMEALVSYDKHLDRAYSLLERQGLVSGLGFGAVILIVFCYFGLAIWYGSKLIIHKGFNGGQVASILVALVYGGMALGKFSTCLNSITLGKASAKKMLEVIERKPEIDSDGSKGIMLENINGEVELRDVYFKYPARPTVEVFSGLSLHIPSGTTVALVGKSGNGKSTVINLIERFYDPQAGEVLIDGVNIKALQLRWLRQKIGLVSQEPVLFDTTIRENILYGKENATEDEIREALELSSAADFINDFPLGLETMVGKGGAQLSGGQKQRIAIARIILKDPRIYLLDEITSALDTKMEKAAYDAIFKIAHKRTTIIVTHNLTSIQDVDRIAVMHGGKIVEQGTHDDLVRDKSGHYSKLLFSQKNNEVENSKGAPARMKENDRDDNFECSPLSEISAMDISLLYNHSLHGETATEVNMKSKEFSFDKCGSVSMARLANLSKNEVPFFLIGFISAVVHGAAFPIFGLLFATAIESFYEPPNMQEKDANHWALMFAILGIVTCLAALLQNYCFGAASSRLTKRICKLSFEKVVHQKIHWFDKPSNSSGAVGARICSNASTLQSLVSNGLNLLVQNMSTFVAGLFIAFFENWILALVLVILFSVVAFQILMETKLLRRFTTNAEVNYIQQSQVASDAIGNIKKVASLCAENKMLDLYQKISINQRISWICLASSINCGLSQFTFYSTSALCFYLGADLVQRKKASTPEIFKVFLALVATAAGVAEASGMALDMKKAAHLASSVCSILDTEKTDDFKEEMHSTPECIVGDIEFKDVRFSYPSRPHVQILKNVSMSILAGETVVLVGESGNGKSTLIHLVERFYDVNSGCILVDTIDIQKYQLKWLRKQIGLVSQEPVLFSGTIRNNISYGKQDVTTEEEIVAAAKLANAHDFISALPDGYDTRVGKHGVEGLSGGQKQRIAIARAIVKNPKILLLDEATSSLDAESEKAVQEALNRVMLNKTTIVVTHRLSTIRASDTIAVLKNGMIIEKGMHNDLVNMPNGDYASLFAHHINQST